VNAFNNWSTKRRVRSSIVLRRRRAMGSESSPRKGCVNRIATPYVAPGEPVWRDSVQERRDKAESRPPELVGQARRAGVDSSIP
jgi:hypothetical protein